MRKVALGLLLFILTACGATAPASDDSTGGASTAPSAAASTPAASAPAASASPAASSGGTLPLPNPSGDVAEVADEVARQASAFLAQQLNQPANALTLQSGEAVEWNDGSLGCPKQGVMYTQAIVPGYKLTFTDGSQTYELHTNADGSTVVWCENGQPRGVVQP